VATEHFLPFPVGSAESTAEGQVAQNSWMHFSVDNRSRRHGFSVLPGRELLSSDTFKAKGGAATSLEDLLSMFALSSHVELRLPVRPTDFGRFLTQMMLGRAQMEPAQSTETLHAAASSHANDIRRMPGRRDDHTPNGLY
jgi:hypothetical protein